MSDDAEWPALPLDAWEPTRTTLHMWTQIVGKVRLALSPHLNHWWQVPLYVSARGLTTSAIPYKGKVFEGEFDFIGHVLRISVSDGAVRTLRLVPKSMASFHAEFMAALANLGIEVRIWTMPVEIPDPIAFEKDTIHADYDPDYAHRLAGMFAARQQVLTTVLEPPAERGPANKGRDRLIAAFQAVVKNQPEPVGEPALAAPPPSVERLLLARATDTGDSVEKEITKGYSIAFVGIVRPAATCAPRFEEPLQSLVNAFDAPIDILVPTGGNPDARLATEIALALADASRGTLTVLHVFDPREDTLMLRGRARRLGMSVLVDARQLGRRSGVPVKGLTATHTRPESEIRRISRSGRYDLIVLGTTLRRGDARFLGPRTLAMVQSLGAPVLLIAL